MPESLKNADPTFYRITKVIDDIVVAVKRKALR
jgi:hypothetical protein